MNYWGVVITKTLLFAKAVAWGSVDQIVVEDSQRPFAQRLV